MTPTLNPAKALRKRIRFLRQVLDFAEKPVVVDIGANPIHVPPYQALMAEGGCTVVGFEPQEEAFEALQKNAGPDEVYVNAAVGRPGKATFYTYPTDGFSSLYQLNRPSLDYLGRFQRQQNNESSISVELRRLDQIKEVPPVDILKMDVQGAEVDILQSGKKKLAKAVAIIPEVRFYRLYQNEPLLGDLDLALRAQGFVLHKFLPPKALPLPNSQSHRIKTAAQRNQLVDGDAVYIRDMEDLDGWSDQQLAHLAIASGCIFDSQDLAIRCLDHLVGRGRVHGQVPEQYADRLPGAVFKDQPKLGAEA